MTALVLGVFFPLQSRQLKLPSETNREQRSDAAAAVTNTYIGRVLQHQFLFFAHNLKIVTKHNCRFPSRCFIWTGCPLVGKRLNYLQRQQRLLIHSDERGRPKEIKYFDFWRIFLAFTVAQKPMTRLKIHTDYKSISI